MNVQIIVPTIGRPSVLLNVIRRLGNQTRRPDGVIVVAVSPDDVQLLDTLSDPPTVLYAPKGLCSQRNRGLAAIRDAADLIIFFDDDFVAADDYLEQAERAFESDPTLVGATGLVIADGVRSGGITFEAAEALIAAQPTRSSARRPIQALYGCNMVLRANTLADLTFDETLPLYGWLEDIDFTYRLGRRGELKRAHQLVGVHMGSKSGRSSGVRLGYSQIANPIYISRRGNMRRDFAWNLMLRNASANVFRSFRPEPHVDRRGRLFGNLIAIRDLIFGNLDPRRILDFQ